MKTPRSVEDSLHGQIKQARIYATDVLNLLDHLEEGLDPKSLFPALRIAVSRVSQHVHELNAYHNVLHTD